MAWIADLAVVWLLFEAFWFFHNDLYDTERDEYVRPPLTFSNYLRRQYLDSPGDQQQ